MTHPSEKTSTRSGSLSNVPRWAVGVAALVALALLTIIVSSATTIHYDEGDELEAVPGLDADRFAEPESEPTP